MSNNYSAECTINVEKLITQQIASEILGKLPAEEKDELLRNAIRTQLQDRLSLYNIHKAIEVECLAMAGEYIKTEEVQTLLREKAKQVVDNYFDGLFLLLGKGLEDYAKNNWYRIFPDKPR